MTDSATAWVPGHVSACFTVDTDDVPARSGSRGAGITLDAGIEVTVCPGDELMLNGTATTIEPVELVLDAMDRTATVDISTQLPLGAGFGVSGGATLGAAIAANHCFALGYSENELCRLAHIAEVTASTGLGDVVAQARGGAPIRLDPGVSPQAHVDGIPERRRIEYQTFGELSTPEIISGDTATVTAAGESALATVRSHPTLATLCVAGRSFARSTELLVPEVSAAIEAVDDVGGEAAMAMLGRTVFALDHGLSDAGYAPEETTVADGGARMVLGPDKYARK